jgi:hypothetical protein
MKLNLFINFYYIVRGNSVAGVYDDLKRNNLLNTDKEEIARAGIKIGIIMFVLKRSKFY